MAEDNGINEENDLIKDIETFDEYQVYASLSAIYPGQCEVGGLNYVILGLAGEAGEIANKFKKVLRDDKCGYSNDVSSIPRDKRNLILDELGDCMWYISEIARNLGISLTTIASNNIDKLSVRRIGGKLGGSGDRR